MRRFIQFLILTILLSLCMTVSISCEDSIAEPTMAVSAYSGTSGQIVCQK